jgi:hypothetical protein
MQIQPDNIFGMKNSKTATISGLDEASQQNGS